MVTKLEQIAKILKELNDELEQDNNNWEKKYGQPNVLRPSDDGITSTGRSDNGCCGKCKK